MPRAPASLDLTGQTFADGAITVVRRAFAESRRSGKWLYRFNACGHTAIATAWSLQSTQNLKCVKCRAEADLKKGIE
jgi:hypothetical protein